MNQKAGILILVFIALNTIVSGLQAQIIEGKAALVISGNTSVQLETKCFLSNLPESSGLVYTDGKIWTHEDSGNTPEIYAIDTVTGNIIQTVRIDNFANTDWEDIAADNDFIYVGDFGNNYGTRTDLKILKIAKKDIGGQENVHVQAEAIQFSYLDQESYAADSKTDFDCEALISFGDSLYIFTKDHRDYQTRVYALPKVPGKYEVNPIVKYDIGGWVTGADCDTLSNEIALLGYDGSKRHSFLYLFSGFQGSRFFSGNVEKVMSADNTKWQTEGICFSDSVSLFLSCESTSDVPSSLYLVSLLSSEVTAVSDYKSNHFSCFPNPASDYLEVQSEAQIQFLALQDINGRLVFSTPVNSYQYQLHFSGATYPKGIYLLTVQTDRKVLVEKIFIDPR